MDYKIVNCTPHPVCVIANGTAKTLFPPSGRVPRITETAYEWKPLAMDWSFQTVVVERHAAEVSDLPDPEDGTWFVVSRMVFDAATDRSDLLVPHDVVRDEDGRIIGCRSFLVRRPSEARANAEEREFLELGRGESAAGCL